MTNEVQKYILNSQVTVGGRGLICIKTTVTFRKSSSLSGRDVVARESTA